MTERVRTLLRIERLNKRLKHFSASTSPYEHVAAIQTLFEVLEVAARADIKSDLLQELERQRQSFSVRNNLPPETTLDILDATHAALAASTSRTGQHIRENEWLMNVRGRMQMPGGACEFDVPSFHAWQRMSPEERMTDLGAWIAPFEPLFEAATLVLQILRHRGNPAEYVARNGSWQQMLSGQSGVLTRVALEQKLQAIPEVSANKYAISVRFLSQVFDGRPKLCEVDIAFTMALCNF